MTDENRIDLVEDWDSLSVPEKVEAMKQTVTVPEVAELLGLEVGFDGKIVSPFNPDERTPSCHLYDDHFYDYSTGRWGDLFDLLMAFDPGLKMSQAVNKIRMRAVKVGKQHGDVEAEKPRELLDFSTRTEWGLYQDSDLHIRYEYDTSMLEGDLLVPHREPGRVYGVKVRGRDGKGSWAGSQFTHRLYDPMGWSKSYFPAPIAVICEGESDCWALRSVPYVEHQADVYALPSGSSCWRDHWLKDLECYGDVRVCMDNDRAGQQARDKLIRKIGYDRCLELKVPQLYGDAREAIDAGWRPKL
jgi:hypothetical protein